MANPRIDRLTDTTSIDTIPVSRPNNNEVVLAFDKTRPGITHFTLPEGSTWAPGLHWHESYTEYVLVIRGRVKVVLDGVSKIVTASDGPQVVEKFVVHAWMRADRDEVDKDAGEVVVEEWTDPNDGLKQVFFRNLFGVLADQNRYWRSWMFLQLLFICDQYDNPVVLLPAWTPRWMSLFATRSLFRAIRAASWVVGLSPWYEAYTPRNLRDIARSKGHVGASVKDD